MLAFFHEKKETFLLTIVLAIAALFFAVNRRSYAIDDAWITYRYAENLAEGKGFVYNPGERVLGTSTPLYTLLLTTVHLFGGNVPVASQTIGFLAMILTLVTIFYLTRELDSTAAALTAILFLALAPEFHAVSTYGMETPLYIAFIGLSFLFYARERLVLATIFSALCFLIRLDGLAVGFFLLLTYVFNRKRFPWKHLLLYLVLTAPWLLFSEFYFGSMFPNSFLAKRLHQSSHVRMWMIEWLLNKLLLVMAVCGAIITLARKRSAAYALALWSVSYVIAFTFSDLYGHTWYRSPLCIPLSIFAAIGVIRLIPAFPLSEGAKKIAAAVLVSILLAPDLYSAAIKFSKGTYGVIPVEATRYLAVGWIKENVDPNAVIASSGIGHLGYFTRNYILDTAGLVSPQVVVQGGAREIFSFAIRTFQPPYIFQAMGRVPADLEKDYVVVNKWKTGDSVFPQFLLLKRISK